MSDPIDDPLTELVHLSEDAGLYDGERLVSELPKLIKTLTYPSLLWLTRQTLDELNARNRTALIDAIRKAFHLDPDLRALVATVGPPTLLRFLVAEWDNGLFFDADDVEFVDTVGELHHVDLNDVSDELVEVEAAYRPFGRDACLLIDWPTETMTLE